MTLIATACVFFVETWAGILAVLAIIVACLAASKVRVGSVAKQIIPLWVILLFTIVANALPFSVSGLLAGCFYALRILLLVMISLVLTTTTSSTEIARSFEYFLRPLGKIGFPSRDVSTIVSIALRFIPVTIDEFQTVKKAQQSRGASFGEGSLLVRARTWGGALIPVFVGLFRRADNLAQAMDSRCYGSSCSTHLNDMKCTKSSWLALLIGAGLFVALAAIT